jgi:serine/threonine protein kinase
MDKEPTAENMKNIQIRRAQITGSTMVSGEDNNGDAVGFTVHFNVEHTPDWHFRAESVEEKANWLIKLSQVHAIAFWLEEYDRVKVLGIGGQGTVYELVHRSTGKRLAMKEMEIKSEKQMQLAISEALFLKSLVENVSHPNIMRIEKVFQVGSKFYLAFPLCTGGELYEAVASRGHFSEHDAAIIMHDLVSALHELHQRDILHLDIKPENILFESKDPHSKILLTDFGLSKLLAEEQSNNPISPEQFQQTFHQHIENYINEGDIEANSIRGTNGYLAPEVIVDGYYTKAADIFASGVVLYILLCGYPPFYTRSTRQTFLKTVRGLYRIEGPEWDVVSDEAKDLVKRMLIVDPLERITTDEILKHPWIVAAQSAEASRLSESPKADIPEKSMSTEKGALTTIEEGDEISTLSEVVTKVRLSDSKSSEPSLGTTSKRRRSIKDEPHVRHVNMSTALSQLQNHIQVLKAEKMASQMTKFLSVTGQQGTSKLADSYLVPIRDDGLTQEEKELVKEIPVDKFMFMVSDDVREALGNSFIQHFAADKNRLTIEEFLRARRQFGLALGANVSNNNPLNQNINVGELLLMKLIDRDNDGYITVEDLYNTQVLITQKNELYLQAVFRIYTEALWYPGRNLNFLNHLQHINFKGANSSVAATVQRLPSVLLGGGNNAPSPYEDELPSSVSAKETPTRRKSKGEERNLDVIEPPKFITSKNVAAVFEKFGYQSKYAETVFNVLCETLQRIRLGQPKQDENDKTTAPLVDSDAERDSDDDDEEELKKVPDSIWSRLSFRNNDNNDDGVSSKNAKKHRMDVNDFMRAARIDDVLVQILFRPQHHRVYKILENAKLRMIEEQTKQLALPENERKQFSLEAMIHEEVKRTFK